MTSDGNIRVDQIWRYPVKSLGGERLESVAVAQDGLHGDRIWCARDEALDEIAFCKRRPGLLEISARLIEGRDLSAADCIALAWRDRKVLIGSEDAASLVSEAARSPMTLWPRQPLDKLSFYARRKAAKDNPRKDLSELFGIKLGERLPDFSAFPKVLHDFATPPGTYFDAYPIHIISLQSLATAKARYADMADVRRFRPNIVVDIPGTDHAHPEMELIGTTIKIGTAELKVEGPCPRCIVPSHAQPGIGGDMTIGRILREEMDFMFGVYATVSKPGQISAHAHLAD
jgi:uncharacterized protein